MYNISAIYKFFLRMGLNWKHWKFSSIGYCPCCDSKNLFLYSSKMESQLAETLADWDLSDGFKRSLLERENYFCCSCSSNLRRRMHAAAVLKLLNLETTRALIDFLCKHSSFKIYETASYNIFRCKEFKKFDNYFVSEYFEDINYGSVINGVRNENLESLSYPSECFDVVINSDVLEHVSDLNKAISEVKRVLKCSGYHVFTIPVDYDLDKTRERSKLTNGRIEHFLKPEYHGDSIGDGRILAFRNFGKDVLDYMGRDGFLCHKIEYSDHGNNAIDVYYAQKK